MIKKYQELVTKVADFKKKDKFDLSSDEDLSLAIMNLVSIEEHLFFTSQKTGKNTYLNLLKEVREMRKVLLKKIIVHYEGEVWCISKHLLAASMRLMEVGTKQLGLGKQKEAEELFNKAYDLYSLFWGLALKMVDTDKITRIDESAINKHDQKKTGFMGKLGNLVRRAIDCCIE